MRLIIHPRSPDVRGWRVIQEFPLDRVPVEPGDSAQPTGDRGAGPSLGLQVAGEAFDVGAADGGQGQGAGAAPGGELAEVECVGLAGQPAVSGQVAGEGEPFGRARRSRSPRCCAVTLPAASPLTTASHKVTSWRACQGGFSQLGSGGGRVMMTGNSREASAIAKRTGGAR